MYDTPTHYFLTAGHAEGPTRLEAFDRALLDAGLGDVNVVRMSSILPPECTRVDPFVLPGGALVPVAYARADSSKTGQILSAAVAVAIPREPTEPGLIMEHHGGARLDEVTDQVRQMARRSMRRRERPIAEIRSAGAEHHVDDHGAAFAGVVLWSDPGD